MDLQALKERQEKRSEEWGNHKESCNAPLSVSELLSDLDDLLEYAEALEDQRKF